MLRITEWLKQKENRIQLLKVALTALFPLLLCVFYCFREGAWIGDLHLASAVNNDTLFYYTQVAAAVEKGIPLGYFGFNESSAECLSFAAWSPVIYIPWVMWGKLFGWGEFSPFACNIFLLSLVLTLIVVWLKPDFKQMVVVGALLAVFPALSRYLMSCLAEIVLVCFVVLFYGLAMSYTKKESKAKIIGLFAIGSFLTWMRPYLVLLLILPAVLLMIKNKVLGWGTMIVIPVVNLGIYFVVQKFFTAEYFWGLYNWDVVKVFFREGIGEGFKNLFSILKNMGMELVKYIGSSLTEGTFLGSNYCVLFVVLFLVLFILMVEKNKGCKYLVIVYWHYVFTCVISFLALLLLMQKINETSRHIMSFIVVGMIMIGYSSADRIKKIWRPAIVFLLCIYLYHVFPDDGKDYQVPILKEEAYEEEIAWKEIYQSIELNEANAPSFENTMIWVFTDKIDGQGVHMSWQQMLSVPAGMGISCCMDGYLIENWDSLKSRYIATLVDGEIAKRCEESNYTKIGEAYGKVLYQRY